MPTQQRGVSLIGTLDNLGKGPFDKTQKHIPINFKFLPKDYVLVLLLQSRSWCIACVPPNQTYFLKI